MGNDDVLVIMANPKYKKSIMALQDEGFNIYVLWSEFIEDIIPITEPKIKMEILKGRKK